MHGCLGQGASGRVTSVATELFHVPLPEFERDGYVFVAYPVPAEGGGAFHLVLGATGTEARFPSLRLYESVWGRVGALPSKHLAWPAIIPGRRGIVFRDRYGPGDGSSGDLWVRRMDVLGFVRLPVQADYVAWTGDGEWMAAGRSHRVVAAPFPKDGRAGRVIAWDIGTYEADDPMWSPDGERLAFTGSRAIGGELDGFDRALFVFTVQ